ncbi:MAG: hypothetical protein OXC19_06035 [Bryobacterales bacterium]|nr:hypothetical protein [Bryobacterales bacterium]
MFDSVLAAVLAIQVGVLFRCFFLARASDSDALAHLQGQFEHDVIRRAKRGADPDWVRYMDEADRVHERRVDRLRSWATAALVVGIGGTMASLSTRLTGMDSNPDSLTTLIVSIGPALWASLSGVVNNLIITLGLFRLSDRRFELSLDQFRSALQGCSEAHQPSEEFAISVREGLADAFREAVRSFPDAFTRLDESVRALGPVMEAQSTMVREAAKELRSSAEGLSDAAREIAPAADLLRASTDRLTGLPTELAEALSKQLSHWEAEIRLSQDSFINAVKRVLEGHTSLLDNVRSVFSEWEEQRRVESSKHGEEWRAAIQTLHKAESAIMATVKELPATFRAEVEQIATRLGREFGTEAGQHVENLSKVVREGIAGLQKSNSDLHLKFLNETSEVIAQHLETVYSEVASTLVKSLSEVGEGLRQAISTLPENAQSFAESLKVADAKLNLSIDQLTKAANHLEQVARDTGQIETSWSNAIRASTVSSFKPLLSQLEEISIQLRRLTGAPKPRGWLLHRLLSRVRRRGKP